MISTSLCKLATPSSTSSRISRVVINKGRYLAVDLTVEKETAHIRAAWSCLFRNQTASGELVSDHDFDADATGAHPRDRLAGIGCFAATFRRR